jgi:hypothetical protein
MRAVKVSSSAIRELDAALGALDRRLDVAVTRATCSEHPVVAGLRRMEEVLVPAGMPPISAWWWETIERFYASGKREAVIRAGRGAGKSTTTCRVAVAEALFGDHPLAPGDIGSIPIISVKQQDAKDRLSTIETILKLLGEGYSKVGDSIRLHRRAIEFRVSVASLQSSVGATALFIFCDEVAYWRDADTGANPATKVLATIRPTMRARANSHLWMVSAPLGQLDAHATAYAEGETARQVVAFAPTWVGNPTITEAQSHAEETNIDLWRQLWAAIPLEGTEFSMLAPVTLDRATRVESPAWDRCRIQGAELEAWRTISRAGDLPPERGVTYVAAMDPAMTSNAWTLTVAGRRLVDGRSKRSVALVREWRGSQSAPLDPFEVLGDVKRILSFYALAIVDTDRYHSHSLYAIGRRAGLTVRIVDSSHGDLLLRYDNVSRWLSDGEVELHPSKVLRKDLLGVKRILTPAGFTIRLDVTPDGRHSDFAPATALALDRARTEPIPDAPKIGTAEYVRVVENETMRRLEKAAMRRAKSGR